MKWRQRINDRLNPILIKEVRQAVRGKFFRVCFTVTLVVAMFAAIVLLSNSPSQASRLDSDGGSQFFYFILLIFSGAAFLVVPLQANRSMAAEKDDKTFDALITSGLRPAQIIFGKWLSSGLLLLLFLSAFAPFLAIGFTLFGINILVCLAFLFYTLAISMSLNLAGLFAACIAKNRAFQTIMLALLSLAGLGTLAIWGTVMSTFLFFSQLFAPGSDFMLNAGIAVIALLLLNYWLYGYTVSAITHQEENGLMHMRVACLLISAFASLSVFLLWTSHHSHEDFNYSIAAAYASLAFLNIPLLTESDRLGVRFKHQLQTGRWRRPLAWMFLPGGTGAVPLYLLQLCIVTLPIGFALNAPATTSGWIAGPAIGLALALALVLIPSAFVTSPKTSAAHRARARFLIPSLPFFLAILTALLGIFGNSRGSSAFNSSMNPFYAMDVHLDGFDSGHAAGLFLWWFFAGGALAWRIAGAVQRLRTVRAIRAKSVKPLAQDD